MRIRRFEAATLAEAVAKVKSELGSDALILSTRKARRDAGLFGMLSRSVVEVTAALDREPAESASCTEAGESSVADTTVAALASSAPALRIALAPLEAKLDGLRRDIGSLRGAETPHQQVERIVADLRRELAGMVTRGAAEADPSEARLIECGIGEPVAREVAALARSLASETALSDAEALRAALTRRFDERLDPPRDDDPGRFHLFVGAPGVGKTTTLAKLAARSVRRGRATALITTDSFRIGAPEQLRTYAELLQVPFAATVSADDAAGVLGETTADQVFIDSAGRSREGDRSLAELCALRDRMAPHCRVHLVLSGPTRHSDLREQLRRFSALRPDSIILAKVDETSAWGELGNIVLDPDLPPVRWLGTGQRVPEDLEVPDPSGWSRRVLGEAA